MNPISSLPVIFLAFANDQKDDRGFLTGLAKEQDQLEEVLEFAIAAGTCEVVIKSNATINNIVDTFQAPRYRDRICIFHYGGHADGYQLLLEDRDEGNVVAGAGGLVSFFAKQKSLQLVYFNGCSTQQQAEELRDAGIPAVVGTVRSIPDLDAVQLAGRFYRGLGSGVSLGQAWEEAQDEFRIRVGNDTNRSLGIKRIKNLSHASTHGFPWRMYYHPPKEARVKAWSLGKAGRNPLFGLPLPESYYQGKAMPESPFPGLRQFQQQDAPVFFGRAEQIRELYNKIQGVEPLLLYYGQSGVGKSSLLRAGLLPRIEDQYSIAYARRNSQTGLIGTLDNALEALLGPGLSGKATDQKSGPKGLLTAIRKLESALPKIPSPEMQEELREMIDQLSLFLPAAEIKTLAGLPQWRAIEKIKGKPLLVILDQVEEVFTRPQLGGKGGKFELKAFLQRIRPLYQRSKGDIKGSLVLSFRKDFLPEIQAIFEEEKLSYAYHFLERLDNEGINEVVTGAAKNHRTFGKYKLEIDEEIPHRIASDLLRDPESPIAPILQIILQKLWERAKERGTSRLSLEDYQNLETTVGDFYEEQIESLRKQDPRLAAAEASGLLIDVLFQHTTPQATATHCLRHQLYERYAVEHAFMDKLLTHFEQLSLLVVLDSEPASYTTLLAHDILAPVITQAYGDSERPGQRASRILNSKTRYLRYRLNPVLFSDQSEFKGLQKKLGPIQDKSYIQLAQLKQAIEEVLDEKDFKKYKTDLWKALEAHQKKQIQKLLLGEAEIDVVEAGLEGMRILTAEEKILLAQSRAAVVARKRKLQEAYERAQYNLAKVFEEKATAALNNARRSGQPGYFQEAWLYTLKALQQDIPADRSLPVSVGRLASNELTQGAFRSLWRSPSRPEAVLAVAFSPDGRLLASASADFTIWLWDLDSGLEVLRLEGHEDEVCHLAFSPDGSLLASAAQDNSLRLWQLSSGRELRRQTEKKAFSSLAFSPDGIHLASGQTNGAVRLWEVRAWQESGLLAGHGKVINDLLFSPDGQLLASASDDGQVKIWRMSLQEEKSSWENHSGGAKCLAFSPDGRALAVGDGASKIQVWDVEEEDVLASLKGHEGGVYGLSFSQDGQNLYSGGEDGCIRKWEIGNELELACIKEHSGPVAGIDISPDGKLLASGSLDFSLRLWELDSNTEIVRLQGHEGMINDLAYSPDGQILASASDDNSIRLWVVDGGQEISCLKGHEDIVWCVAFSPDGQILASGSNDDSIRLWSWAGGQELAVLKGHGSDVLSLAFSPDGKILASGSDDNTIRLWELESEQEIACWTAHRSDVRSVAFSPDGGVLASAHYDHTVSLWKVAEGEEIRRLEGHEKGVNEVAFSPDGQLLGSVADDESIRIWKLPEGELLKTLKGHEASVMSISFSPDSRLLASGSEDNSVRIWEIATGGELACLQGRGSDVQAICFSPDGQSLAAGYFNRTIRLWGVQIGFGTQGIKQEKASIDRVAISPDGKLIASGLNDEVIRLWEVGTEFEIGLLEGHKKEINFLAFSPDSQVLASASKDESIRIWSVSNGQKLRSLRGHKKSVTCLAFSPDGQLLASGSDDNDICIWEIASGKKLNRLKGHQGDVRALAFSPDGELLISGSQDDSIRVWEIANALEIARLEGHGSDVQKVQFSTDGGSLITTSEDETRTWDFALLNDYRKARSQSPEFEHLLRMSLEVLPYTSEEIGLSSRHEPYYLSPVNGYEFPMINPHRIPRPPRANPVDWLLELARGDEKRKEEAGTL